MAGGDLDHLGEIVERYRTSLYPESVAIDREAAARVQRAQEVAGLLTPGDVELDSLLDLGALSG